MNKSKLFLKLASIINLVLGILSLNWIFYSVLLIVSGLFLYILSIDEKDYKKELLYVIGFIMLPLNIFSAILIFISIDKMKSPTNINSPPNSIELPSKESKQLDILLKLGVGLVILAGILFSTTSWDSIPNIVKILSLIILGVLFLGLSYFSEIKIKIQNTTYLYWILSMSLFLLSVVGLFSFGLISDKITYQSTYSSLCFAITFFILSIILLGTYYRFKKKYLYHFFYLSLITTSYFILNSIKIDNITIICIISTILLIINITSEKKGVLYSISKLSSYLMIPLIIKFYNSTPLIVSITCLINIINIIYLLFKEKDIFQLIKLLLIDLLIILGINTFKLELNYTIFLIFIITTFLVTIIKWLNQSILIKEIHYIIYSILTLILLILLEDNNITILIISLIYLLETILQSITINNSNNITISKYIEPFSIMVSLFALFNLDNLYNKLIPSEIIFLGVVLFSIIYFFIKEEKRRNIYYYAIYLGTILGLFLTISNNEGIPSLLYIITSTYLFFITRERNDNINLYITCIILLTSIFSSITVINVFNLPIFLTCIILIGILLLISTITKNKIIKQISLFYVSIPLYYLLKSFNDELLFVNIIGSIIILYITFLITKFFCKSYDLKSALGIIGIFYSLRIVFFTTDILVAIYIATVGLIITILGFYKKELTYFFPIGIGIIVADILYQLKDMWKNIPFYFYLLIIGLGIITFVTIKQLKKTK